MNPLSPDDTRLTRTGVTIDRSQCSELATDTRRATFRFQPGSGVEPREQAMEPGVLARIVDTVAAWQKRSRDRRLLSELSEWQRRDIGLSRATLDDEVSTPFWRV